MKKEDAEKYPSLSELLTLNLEGLKGIFNDITNGITLTDEHSTILYVNPAFTTITGYSYEEAVGDNPGRLHSGKHDQAFYKQMWDDIRTKGRWQGEIWNRRKTGEVYPEFLTITRLLNTKQEVFYLAIFADITTIEREDSIKIKLAFRDPLTNLYNRSFLEEKFNEAVRHYQRSPLNAGKIALLFIDINKFKDINDTYGHLAGDALLVHVATALFQSAREVDTIARYGGDEFVILLSEIRSSHGVMDVCNRIQKNLRAGETLQEKFTIPAISIGVSVYPVCSTHYTTLIEQADKAMYYGKKNNQFVTFYEDLEE